MLDNVLVIENSMLFSKSVNKFHLSQQRRVESTFFGRCSGGLNFIELAFFDETEFGINTYIIPLDTNN